MTNVIFSTKNVLLRTMLFALLAILGASNEAFALEVIDLGRLELNKEYQLKDDFNDYKGHFVAPRNGTLTVTSSNGCLMLPYMDEECENAISYVHSSIAGYTKETYDIPVTEGNTYFFLKDFCMSSGVVVLTMNDTPTIEIDRVQPETGSTYMLTSGDNISITFNKAIFAGGAELLAGTKSIPLNVSVWGSFLSLDVKNSLMGLMKDGTLKSGTRFTIRIHNVRSVANEALLYGTDGTIELSYVCGDMPVSLVGTEGIEGAKFLSYWMKGDEAGKVKFIFDGEILSAEGRESEAIFSLNYGEMEAEGEFYTETLPFVVEGNTISVDITGKLRRPQDMIASGKTYEKMVLRLNGVRDSKGNFAYNDASGTLGSYTFDMPYEEITADVATEFIPRSGQSLTGVKEIEIWISDYEKLRHDGILFTYGEGEPSSEVVKDFSAVKDTEFEGAYILTVPVPAAAASHANVTVTLNDLLCADGMDHSALLTATYVQPDASGIENAVVNALQPKAVYSLSGVKMPTDTRSEGIYVIDGKKTLIRK